MNRRNPRSIYGSQSKHTCVCEPGIPPTIGLTLFSSLLNNIKETINKFFPRANINAPFTADMYVGGALPARIVIRLLWIQQNPGIQFDRTDQTHLYQVKDLYLSKHLDWRNDILFAN